MHTLTPLTLVCQLSSPSGAEKSKGDTGDAGRTKNEGEANRAEDRTDEVPLMDNNERPQGVSREAPRTKGTHTVVSECHVFPPLFWLISRNADR